MTWFDEIVQRLPSDNRASLAVGSAVAPGQEIAVIWSFESGRVHGPIIAQIGIPPDFNLYTSRPIALSSDGNTGSHSAVIHPPTNPSIARELYALGHHDLVLGIRDRSGRLVALQMATVEVEFAHAATAWWVWESPTNRSAAGYAWKEPYTVGGRLTNQGKVPVRLRAAYLNEQDRRTGQQLSHPFAGNSAQHVLAPGTSVLGQWPRTQAWQWLAPPLGPFARQWDEHFPRAKLFDYRVEYVLEDAYGNAYSAGMAQTTGGFSVIVAVPPRNSAFALVTKCLGTIAGMLAVGAAICLLPDAPILYEWSPKVLLIASEYVYATLGAMAWTQALDLVKSDLAGQEPVAPEFLRLPEALQPAGRSSLLQAVLEPIGTILAALHEVSRSERHTAGDGEANDGERPRILAKTSRPTGNSIVDELSGLQDSLRGVVPELATDAVFGPGALGPRLVQWQAESIPVSVTEIWQQSGVPQTVITALQEGSSLIGLMPHLLEGLGTHLLRVADALLEITSLVADQTQVPAAQTISTD